MKRLYDRLKPEYKTLLDQEAKKYPFLSNSLMTSLKEVEFYVDLRYGDVCILINHLNLKDYSPLTVDNLFTNENTIS